MKLMANPTLLSWREHHLALAGLRREVFIQEQRVPVSEEWDGKDESAWHFGTYAGEQLIACARVVCEPWKQTPALHIGRVAVQFKRRNKGVGSELMRHILQWAGTQKPLFLHAQVTVIPFYQGLGFELVGDTFMDAGIPHRTMVRTPNSTGNAGSGVTK